MALEKRKSKSLETLDESKKILVKTVKMTTNKDQFLISKAIPGSRKRG